MMLDVQLVLRTVCGAEYMSENNGPPRADGGSMLHMGYKQYSAFNGPGQLHPMEFPRCSK